MTIGADYGWPLATPCGPQAAGTQLPLALIPVAPTGCCVYRGAACPEFAGDVFFGTCQDRVMRAVFHAGSRTVVDEVILFHIFVEEGGQCVLDVTVGPDGLLWLATSYGQNGFIWRVLPPSQVFRLKAPPNPFVSPGPRGAGPPKH